MNPASASAAYGAGAERQGDDHQRHQWQAVVLMTVWAQAP